MSAEQPIEAAPSSVSALPAPPPYDAASPDVRISCVSTSAGLVLIDLLLGVILEVRRNGVETDSSVERWQRFTAVGRVEVGSPILFRLATDRPFITSPVTTIDWLGPKKRIDPRDFEAMKIIGDMLTNPKRPKRWWHRG